jgi:hypothetical protein
VKYSGLMPLRLPANCLARFVDLATCDADVLEAAIVETAEREKRSLAFAASDRRGDPRINEALQPREHNFSCMSGWSDRRLNIEEHCH